MSRRALKVIEKNGILLLYAIGNRSEPRSVWTALYPGIEKTRKWDATEEERVDALWEIKKELSASRSAIYAKWYQGRGTMISRRALTLLLAGYGTTRARSSSDPEAKRLMEVLDNDSPLSTKDLRKLTDLSGKIFEATFSRAIKTLWNRLEIVALDDGRFSPVPVLSVGSTKLVLEDLWDEAKDLNSEEARDELRGLLGEGNPFFRYFEKNR